MTKEEFEKEAEERARKLEEKQTLGVYDNEEELAQDVGWNAGEVSGYEDGFKDGAEFVYNKAKVIIKEMLSVLPKENIEGIYEITEEAEHFISEVLDDR